MTFCCVKSGFDKNERDGEKSCVKMWYYRAMQWAAVCIESSAKWTLKSFGEKSQVSSKGATSDVENEK